MDKLPVGRPPRFDKDNTKVRSVEKGTMLGDKRKTYIVSIEVADKMDAIAFWGRLSTKEVINTCFLEFIERWEKKNGKLRIPLGKSK